MKRIKLPFISTTAFKNSAVSLLKQLKPSVRKVGSPPGTLTYTGHETSPTEIRFFQYDKNDMRYHALINLDELTPKLSDQFVNWVDVTGFENIDLISQLGALFNIDQLTMEDMLNVGQLPKIEEREEYLYITLKLVDLIEEENSFEFTHYSLIIRSNELITFSERPNKQITFIEDRLKNNLGIVRGSGINYLSYGIMDNIVDHYYFTLDWFTNILAELEAEMIENPSKKHINTILTFKKQWLLLRKAIYPFKEAIRKLVNMESAFIKSAGKHYVGDLHDHLQSIGETMEILRETLENLMDLYTSAISNKMNEVMQVLTVVATIFIPLTFIAGIYGMNFENMPELSWENGYFYVLGLMAFIGIWMIIYIRRKHWL